MRSRTSVVALFSVVVAFGTSASGDWPMIGQNPQRTARATEPSRLSSPAITWRHYLGGAVAQGQLISAQVDGVGLNELVFISSGKLVVKRPDDTLLWESAPMGLARIEGIADFNGDGQQEIVASGRPGMVAVFALRDGALRWRTDPADFSPLLGEVRIARLNADMLPDLYVADLAASQLVPRPESMFGYSFAMGFGGGVDMAMGAQRIWQLPTGRDTAQSFQDVLADLNNDGVPELVAFGSRYAYLYNARTGTKIASGGPDPNGGFSLGITLPFGLISTHLVDVDNDGSMDIVGFSNNAYPLPDTSRHVLVMSYDSSRPVGDRLYRRWSRGAPDLMTDAHLFAENTVADLDGDMRPEIVTTFREGARTQTYIFNAATGAVRATIDNASVVGVYSDLNDGQRPVVLVRRGGSLEGYRGIPLTGAALAAPTFTLGDGVVPRYLDNARSLGAGAKTYPITSPLPGAGMRRGIVIVRNNGVESYDVSMGAMPAMAGRYAFPADVTWSTIVPQDNVSVMGQGLLIAQTDGYIVAVDPALRALNQGSVEFPERGVRCGGFYSGAFGLGAIPTAARLDPDVLHSDVVTVDGRGILNRLDVSRASLARPPVTRFQRPGARFPLLESTVAGPVRDLIVSQIGRSVVGLSVDGMREVFRIDAATAEQSISGDTVPLRDGLRTRYAAPVNGTNGLGQITAVDPMATVAWRTAAIATGSSIPGYLAVDELDNDGADDVLVTFNAMKLYSGRTGALLGSSRFTGYAAMPITVRGLMASVTHLFMASAGPPAAATLPRPLVGDFDSTWVYPNTFSATRQFAGVVQCMDGLRVAQARDLNAELTIVPAATFRAGMTPPSVTLAGGRLFATVAEARAASLIPGVLGNVTTTQQLSANQPAVLVGSTDGYLYAVDPCGAAPRLLWALNFRASVGQPILADTDGDGEAEIVVTSADGFLYGVDTQAFAPPMWVHDVDPNDSMATDDIDEVTAPAISVAWAEVPGATAYEWAVFTSAGTAISRNPMDMSNPFTQVAPAIRRVSFADGLRSGGRYFFAVRVIGATGSSPEAVSDGVLYTQGPWRGGDAGVIPLDAPGAVDGAIVDATATRDAGLTDARGGDAGTAPQPGGCGCRVAAKNRNFSGQLTALCAALAALLVRGRRSQRRV